MSSLNTTATYYRVGASPVHTGIVGFDRVPCVARFAFTTDAQGASTIRFHSIRMEPSAVPEFAKPGTQSDFCWLITREDSGYESAWGSVGWPVDRNTSTMSGTRDVALLPNTRYYLWIMPMARIPYLWGITGILAFAFGSYGTPSTPEVGDGFFGRPLSISLNRSHADAVHSVAVDCAGRRTQLLDQSAQYPTLTWEPSLADYGPLLPDTDAAPATVTVETYCQGAYLGSVSKTVTMRIPEGALEPALSEGWLRLEPRGEGSAAPFHVLIEGRSRLEAIFDSSKIDAAPLLGASITGCALEAQGETVSAAPYLSPVLTGAQSVAVVLTDSRGQLHRRSFPVTPEPYAPPSLSEIRVFRCDSDGTENESGTALGVFARLDYSSLAGENSCSLSAALRPPEGSFGAETAMQSAVLCVIPGQSPDQSVQLRITAVDGLGSEATALRTLPTRRWAMKFRPDGQGVAFGKAPEFSACLELPGDWEIRLGRESLWLRQHPVGSLVLSDAAPAEGTWADQGAVLSTHLWRRSA